MRRTDILRMALSSLGANKLRSSLTMLGITIGVFSIIGVMTAISALQGSIESGLSFLGSNIFQFSRTPIFQGNDNEKYRNRPNISYAQGVQFARWMREDTEVVCLKVFKFGAVATSGGRKTNPNQDLVGTNQYALEANSLKILSGRMLNAGDVELARSVIVIGEDIRKKLFPVANPLGQRVRMAGRNFEIIGIFEPVGSGFGGSKDNFSAIPITRFLADFGANGRSLNISVQSKTQATYDATLGRAVGVMRKVRGLQVEDGDNFDIYSNDSLTAAFTQVAGTIRIGAFVISGIALIAAGVGIMNIMLVSVTERTKEIGVRKSLGARRGDILGQFLLESLFLSELGGLAGIVLGALGGNALAIFIKASVYFPWGWALLGLFVCSAIGIGFGMYPAQKAAALDPVEALRFE